MSRKRKISWSLLLVLLSAIPQFGCSDGNIASSGKSAQNGQVEPLLAVLCTADRSINVIDAKRMKSRSKIGLRSLCLNFAAGENGKVYTSQTGLAGQDADNAIGVVDVRRGVVESYIKLKGSNPGEIAFADGKIVVENGVMENNGNLIGEVIDARNDYKSTVIELLGVTGSNWAANNGKIYMSSLKEDRGARSERRNLPQAFFSLDLKTKKISKVFDVRFASIAFDVKGTGYGLIPREYGTRMGLFNMAGSKDRIVVFDAEKKKIKKVIELEKQSKRADRLTIKDDKLYVTFFNATNPEPPTGDAIGIVDLKTGKMRTIKGFKGPSFVLPVGDRIYVANYDNGTVDMVEEKTGHKLSSIKVGKWPMSMVYIDGKR